ALLQKPLLPPGDSQCGGLQPFLYVRVAAARNKHENHSSLNDIAARQTPRNRHLLNSSCSSSVRVIGSALKGTSQDAARMLIVTLRKTTREGRRHGKRCDERRSYSKTVTDRPTPLALRDHYSGSR